MSRPKTKPLAILLADEGLRDCMKSQAGRAFLWSMLEDAGVFRISANMESPLPTYFAEGGRNQGNKLLLRIQEADIDRFLVMQKEAFARTKLNDHNADKRRTAEYGNPAGNGHGIGGHEVSDDDGQGVDDGRG